MYTVIRKTSTGVDIRSSGGNGSSSVTSLVIGDDCLEMEGLGVALDRGGERESFRRFLARTPLGESIFFGEMKCFPRCSEGGCVASPFLKCRLHTR